MIAKKKKPVFLRTGSKRYKRLGKGRKSLQRWRRPKGRHNKIRQSKISRFKKVKIGYKNPEEIRGTIKEKKVMLIGNLRDIEKAKKGGLAIVAKLGKKKRETILKLLKEKNIEVLNKRKEEK